jgi:hypothetical protein
MQQGATTQWLTVLDIAAAYGKGVSATRAFLNRKLKAPEWKEHLKTSYRAGKGRHAAFYSRDFVIAVMGEIPNATLSNTEREIFSRDGPSIKMIGGENGDPITGILASRRRAMNAYNELVDEMTRAQRGLRIRCITGTDFFTRISRGSIRLRTGLRPVSMLPR